MTSQHYIPIVNIVGAGLAGSEAAFFLARRGVRVRLFEMRPDVMTPAHKTGDCAELVCSNSFKSTSPDSAPGILKSELQALGSLALASAQSCSVPAGSSLAVDRQEFARRVTEKLKNQPLIEWVSGLVSEPPKGLTLLATGPLTAPDLTRWLERMTSERDLYFYDAIAPVVAADSISWEHTFVSNRHEKGGEAAYVNCPLNEGEYYTFVHALMNAEQVPARPFEDQKFYAGCQPIEAIAAGGPESLRFGPMRPVGLVDPKTSKRPFAVVQLRPENLGKSAYNIVGFQTKLKYSAQKDVLKLIPALQKVEFLKFGSVHRNTYLCSPKLLRPDLSFRGFPNLFAAGQITGVEGYFESASSGLLCAVFILQRILGQRPLGPPATTAMGSLLRHVVASPTKSFQPSGIQFGLFEPLFFENPSRQAMATQAREDFGVWVKQLSEQLGLGYPLNTFHEHDAHLRLDSIERQCPPEFSPENRQDLGQAACERDREAL